MRTTITLDDALAGELKRRALETGKPFKQVVNETLRAGLQRQSARSPRPYRVKPAALGAPLPGIKLEKALRLADELEDFALEAKLESRK
ncbi:MAG: DUF2191 domain-containing protein [Pseudomonadota bacterium]